MQSSSQRPAADTTLAADKLLPRSWFWTLYSWTTIIAGMLLAAFLCVMVGGAAALLGDRRRLVAHRMLAFGYRLIWRVHPSYGLRLSGVENLPRGPCILCANHQSYADVVFLYWLPLPFKWIIKKELFKVPVFGAAMRVADYPMIDRGNPDSAMALMQRVRHCLEQGVSILSFPEGTRSANGSVGRFQSGTARMALATGVPLVPVGVVGTANILPRGGGKMPIRAAVGIHIGPAISTEGVGQREVRGLTRRLRAAVIEAKHQAQASLLPRDAGARVNRVDEASSVG